MIQLDYTLDTVEERKELVEKILAQPGGQFTSSYLEILADYLIFIKGKKIRGNTTRKKDKSIITPNRKKTMNKREISFDGYVSNPNTPTDAIYGMISNDKNMILTNKVSITPDDIKTIPGMASLREAIEKVKVDLATASGARAFTLKKTIIELSQSQYILKNAYKKPIFFMKTTNSLKGLNLREEITLDENDDVVSNGVVSLVNEKDVSMLLCNYSNLKEESYEAMDSDIKWMLLDLEEVAERALLPDHPILHFLMILKIDGMSSEDIAAEILEKYGVKYSVTFISKMWRERIPNLIATLEREQWVIWHYTNEEMGKWKVCSRCGEAKPAHKYFFNKNKDGKFGLQSRCKECRRATRKSK